MTRRREVRALLLAAGFGTRLRPLTDSWPKCLMPVGGRPLMEYWLQALQNASIGRALVNLHYHAGIVSGFLDQSRFQNDVTSIFEPALLGTAATLRANTDFFSDTTVLLVHADNWSDCDLSAFIEFHQRVRKPYCPISMMTFTTDSPHSCGIVETDADDVLIAFHEKVANPPGNRANAAVYLLEPEVLHWLQQHPSVTDFSTEVLPHFVGRIACWHHEGIHRDIGTIQALQQAQRDVTPALPQGADSFWQQDFLRHPIQRAVVSDPVRVPLRAAL